MLHCHTCGRRAPGAGRHRACVARQMGPSPTQEVAARKRWRVSLTLEL
jgi:hypothetical protein